MLEPFGGVAGECQVRWGVSHELMARTTAHLPMSPRPEGLRTYIAPGDPEELEELGQVDERIAFVDNYVRFVEAILDHEVLIYEDVVDQRARRTAAEEVLYAGHPAAVHLMTAVELAALDTHIKRHGSSAHPARGDRDEP